MLKLACVSHSRCNELVAQTFLMVPEELTQEEFSAAVERAEKAYEADASAWEQGNSTPVHPMQFSWKKFPDTFTVGQLRAAEALAQAEYREWQKRKDTASRSFGFYLLREITGSKDLWDNAEELNASVDWGHQHGRKIWYGETDNGDLRGAAFRPVE